MNFFSFEKQKLKHKDFGNIIITVQLQACYSWKQFHSSTTNRQYSPKPSTQPLLTLTNFIGSGKPYDLYSNLYSLRASPPLYHFGYPPFTHKIQTFHWLNLNQYFFSPFILLYHPTPPFVHSLQHSPLPLCYLHIVHVVLVYAQSNYCSVTIMDFAFNSIL